MKPMKLNLMGMKRLFLLSVKIRMDSMNSLTILKRIEDVSVNQLQKKKVNHLIVVILQKAVNLLIVVILMVHSFKSILELINSLVNQ